MPSHIFKNGFFYGWVVIIISLVTSIILLGIRYTFGIFFKSIGSEFDLTRATTSGIFSAYMALSAVFSILGGWALDKYGPRFTISLMGLFSCISLLLTAWASSVWQLYISYSLLLAVGTGATYTVFSALVSRWFHKKRGLALGISGAGGGLGIIIMAPFATYLLVNSNWRMANIVIALIAGVLIIPLSMFLRGQPSELGLLPDGAKLNPGESGIPAKKEKPQLTGFSLSEAVRMRQFWFLFLIWIFQAFATYFIVTHLVPHATDVGISATEAARIVSVTGAFQIISGLAAGSASDAIGRRPVAITSSLLGTVALLLLMWSHAAWLFYLFAILFGLCRGGLSTMVSALVGDVFGMRNIGAILGWIGVAWFVGAAVGPVIGGLIFDVNKSYFLAFLISAICMLVTALLASRLTKSQKTT